MILVCGSLADSVTELVCARLEDCGYPYRLLNMGLYPAGYQVSWRWQGAIPTGYIRTADWRLELSKISAVYVRYPGAEERVPPADVPAELTPALYAECDAALTILLEQMPCLVVNRAAGGMSNSSKTYQALIVRECGLLTPPTLVTSDPQAAQRFYDEHNGDVIYKSLSGIRSIVRSMDKGMLDRLPHLRHSPTQFQVFIPGDNVRVHTVGDEVIATRIHSAAVDYRYAQRDGYNLAMEETTLPPAVAAACLKLAHRLDLALAGIDLKETPSGEYYCFEVNPSPGFIYYELHSGQPISLALANLLHRGAMSG
jgi:glutathione synthase/RimK-type ligase-like ATP-grasp enzyme